MDRLSNFEAMLARGQDSALLRFALGEEYLTRAEHTVAADHLAEAVRLDPGYSAAWKLYGKALAGADRIEEAKAAYAQGVRVAEAKGDLQAAKEMKVFLRRLEKPSAAQ